MKKLVFGLLAIAACLTTLSGCYKAIKDIPAKDAGNYVKVLEYTASGASAYDASPMSYQFIKGENAYADYTFKAIKLEGPFCIGLYGDPSDFLKAYFKEADLIMGYREYWFIGTKKTVKE